MIACLICGKEYSYITAHLKHHEILAHEYLNMFPEAKLYDEEMAVKLSVRGRHNNQVRIDKASPEELSRIGRKMANAYYSNASEEDEIARSKAISDGWKVRLSNPELLEEARAHMLKATAKWLDKLKNMSNEDLAMFLDRSFCKIYKKYEFEYKGNVYGVRSEYEETVLKALVDLQIQFLYEPFMFEMENGHKYRPEFVVDDLVIEVKSLYFFNKEENDLRSKAVIASGYRYALLMEEQIFNNDLHLIIGNLTTSARHQ